MIDEHAGLPLIGPVAPPALHIMTFNIRRRMDGLAWRRADRWRHRAPAVRARLRLEQPTVAGLQEVMPDQADSVLVSLGRRYRFVGRGHGRRGTGEGCPLFYDAERLELLHWEQTALSEYPHEAGSRTWGNPIPRIAVAARFRDRATGGRFTAVNTHLDPFSPRSRLRSADALKAVIDSGSRTLRDMLDGGLRDAWSIAEHRVTASVGTFANYRTPRPDRARIDWILVTPGVAVQRAAINTRLFAGVWPSDHLPVQAVLSVPDEPEQP